MATSFMRPKVLRESDPPACDRSLLPVILGPLETQVMEALWSCGECNVREVLRTLERNLAYTTVMSTLDRLFRKNLVSRRKRARAYMYSPCVTCQEWKDAVARDLLGKLMGGPQVSRELLIQCLMEAVGQMDGTLVEDIARTAREKRTDLAPCKPQRRLEPSE